LVAGIVTGWAALAVFVETSNAVHHAPLELVLHDWVPGASWLLAGLVAWSRRPDVVIGRVMVVIGFAWFIGGLGYNPWIVGTSQLLSDVDLSLIVWLVFAYPIGRITRRYERVYVVIVISWIALTHLGDTLTFSPPTYFHCPCLPNALAVLDNPHAYDTIHSIEDPISTAVAAGVFALLVLRFVRSSRAARRSLGGLWVGSLLLAAFEVIDNIINSNNLTQPEFLFWDWWKDVAYAAIPIAFTLGLAGVRSSRGRVGRLVDDLSATEGARLHMALARALGDPSVQVFYRMDGSDRLVDADGRDRGLPNEEHDRAVTPVAYRGEHLGMLVHDPALTEQPELIGSVCAAAGMALANERLQAEVRAQLAEVRASRARIVQAGDAERKRIERNLHDGAQQRLAAIRLNLRLAASRAEACDRVLEHELESSVAELDEAILELRTLARGIHPAVLTDEGLAAAVDILIERASVPIGFADQLAGRLPTEIEAAAYYVIAEALTNIEKYAHAARAEIALTTTGHQLCVVVTDDGIGGADPARGSGLRGLDDRVAAAGGLLHVTSPVGCGTSVRAELPLPQEPCPESGE
jgi:signal transduction histidine kinase